MAGVVCGVLAQVSGSSEGSMARSDIHNFEQWFKMADESAYRAKLLSKKLNVSRRQLQRYTQTIFGRSPQAWLSEQRLIIAGKMIKEHRSVKIVAFHLGFKQVSHFSREFKLYYGLAPTTFLAWNDRQSNSRVPSNE
jgi:AraC-like DNA-binding protein